MHSEFSGNAGSDAHISPHGRGSFFEKVGKTMRSQVFSLLVDNNPGVLSRIAGLFSRRGYRHRQYYGGDDSRPRYTRITVVSSGDELILSQIEKQLRKLEDVVSIKVLKDSESVCRELSW